MRTVAIRQTTVWACCAVALCCLPSLSCAAAISTAKAKEGADSGPHGGSNSAPVGARSVRIVVGASVSDPSAGAAIAAVVARQIEARCNTTVVVGEGASADFVLTLELEENATIGPEGFVVTTTAAAATTVAASLAGGTSAAVTVTGGDTRGILYGCGRWLHNSRFDGAMPGGGALSAFVPGAWRGTDRPRIPNAFRAMYFATHFQNFYESAPLELVQEYVEDIALWGVNTLIVELPGPSSFDDGEREVKRTDPQIAALLNRTRALLELTRHIGLSPGVIIVPNQGYADRPDAYTPFPDPLHVRGNLGALTCADKGRDYLVDLNTAMLDQYANNSGLDWIVFWPYDEGGCGCGEDWPWGGRGFPRISSQLMNVTRARYPHMRGVVATWCFDKPVVNGSEYAGLDAFIRRDREARHRAAAGQGGRGDAGAAPFDFVMVDDHGDFPRWPLDHGGGRVGGLQLLNFPEISMWGRSPWGGWGANPLPDRFERLWNETEGSVVGGMPYSEGIYEDMNAVIAFRHYWLSSANANDTLRDYVSFEFSAVPEHVDAVMQAVAMLEKTWPGPGEGGMTVTDPESVRLRADAWRLVSGVDAELTPQARSAWRWRMLFLRAEIDNALGQNGGEMRGPVLCRAFTELARIQHVGPGSRVSPPSVPCSNHSCEDYCDTCTPGVCPANQACPARPWSGGFVPWVRAVSKSNVFGVRAGADVPGVPLLGKFASEDECRGACEALSNCTQYSWSGNTQGFENACYGRCDAVWVLHDIPVTSVPGVSARRVAPSR